jgi:hypothetical protein
MAAPNSSAALGARFFGPLQSPIQISATYQINGGTAIAAGASITDSKTFTGALATDTQIAVGYDDAVAALLAPLGLVLSDVVVTAANTVSLTWTNTTSASVTPPATSQQYWLVRLGVFYGR